MTGIRVRLASGISIVYEGAENMLSTDAVGTLYVMDPWPAVGSERPHRALFALGAWVQAEKVPRRAQVAPA